MPRPEAGNGYGLLLAGFAQRLHADRLGCGLVGADEERVARARRIGLLHLRLEAAAAGVDDDLVTGVTQHFARPPCETGGGSTVVNDVCEWRAFAGDSRLLQEQDDPLNADGEAAGRCGPATQSLEQSVVTAASRDRALRPQPIGDPLEHRPIVVVETAHQPPIDRERDAVVRQELLHAIEMGAGLGAEPLDELRRAPDQVLQIRILGVQDAQRIGVQPAFESSSSLCAQPSK